MTELNEEHLSLCVGLFLFQKEKKLEGEGETQLVYKSENMID